MTRVILPAPHSTSTAASTWPKLFEIRLLGEPEFISDGTPVTLKLARPRCIELLALCVLHTSRRLSRAALAAHLWPELSEEEARANLRRHLSELTAALSPYGDFISADRQSVNWTGGTNSSVDVLEFEKFAAASATHEQALKIYRADLLSSVYIDWAFAPRERLRSTAVQIAHSLANIAMRDHDFSRALEYSQRAVDLGDWREDSLRLLMSAMYAMGNRAGALAAFDRFSAALAKDMNVAPMLETFALRDSILNNAALPETLPSISNAPLPTDDTPFVGRDEDLHILEDAWDRAARRAGNSIFVGGDAGIGKTRLVREFARYVDERGGQVLWGHASPDATTTYQPIIDAIKGGISAFSDEHLDDVWIGALASVIPEIGRLRPDAVAPPLEGARSAERLREGFARAFDAISRRRPCLIIIEDIHWSDVDTIEALAHLARRVRGGPMLLVLTHRSEEVPLEHPLRAMRRTLLAENNAIMRSIAPLNADAVSLLTSATLRNATPEIGASIARASGGNPLFAMQIIQHYSEQGGATEGIRELNSLVAARIDRLSADERAILSLGAMIDLHFTVEELAHVSGQSEASVLACVDTLLDARYLKWSAAPGFRLTFAHQLLRNFAMKATPEAGSAPLHRRIATILEKTRSGDMPTQAVIARHCELGGLPERAYELYLSRAQAAMDIYAYRSTVELASDALRVASGDLERFSALRIALVGYSSIAAITQSYGDAVTAFEKASKSLGAEFEFEALQARATYHLRSAEYPELDKVVGELIDRAELAERKDWIGAAYQQQGQGFGFQGRVGEAIASLTKALEYFGPESTEALHARAHRATMLLRGGEFERGLAEFERLDRIQKIRNDALLESMLCIAYQTVAIMREEPALLVAAGNRLIAHSERTGALGARAVGMSLLQHERFLNGDVARGREMAVELFSFMEKHGMKVNRLAMKGNMAFCERQCGNLSEAIDLWTWTLAQGEMEHQGSSIIVSCIGLAEAWMMRGDLEKAIEFASHAMERAKEGGETRLEVEIGILVGALEIRTGAFDEGMARIRAYLPERKINTSPHVFSDDLSLVIESCDAMGRLADVDDCARELEELYKKTRDSIRTPARVCASLAMVAAARGDVPASKRYIFEGTNQLKAHQERITDLATRENYAALPFCRWLSERDPAKR